MKLCSCPVSRPNPSPFKTNCLRCGFKARPKPPPPVIVSHCARCGDDLVSGQSSYGMLYRMNAIGGAQALHRFCIPCHDLILEGAVTYRTPAEVEIERRGAP